MDENRMLWLQGLLEVAPSRGKTVVAKHSAGVHREVGAPLQQPTFALYPELTAKAWYQQDAFWWTAVMKDHWVAIKNEFSELRHWCREQDSVDTIRASVADGGCWNTLYLLNEGMWDADNCARCPVTMHCLSMVDICEGSGIGYAYFSVISPGTHITPHCGVCNCKLRCHLALQVPEGDGCTISVANESRTWQEGECLIFDDSFLHEVRNDMPDGGAGRAGAREEYERVVLLFDFWHADLEPVEKMLIAHCLPTLQYST